MARCAGAAENRGRTAGKIKQDARLSNHPITQSLNENAPAAKQVHAKNDKQKKGKSNFMSSTNTDAAEPITIDAVKTSLAALAKGDLFKQATAFFKTLGYYSDRVISLPDDSPGTFCERFAPDGIQPGTITEKELRKKVKSIRILFQFVSEDIKNTQQDLEFSEGHHSSFLFVAAELVQKQALYTRSNYTAMTREISKRFMMPVFVLFRYERYISLAFADRRPSAVRPGREVLGKVSLLRDIAADEPHAGHLRILLELSFVERRKRLEMDGKSLSFDELHKALLAILDTKTMSRQFYGDLLRWFDWAANEAKFPLSDKHQENHLIRLITRLLFVWFVKEKGLVNAKLFAKTQVEGLLKKFGGEHGDYYRAVLQNLFFATLNTEIAKRGFSSGQNKTHRNFNLYRYAELMRDKNKLFELMEQTPFINGGLFDCLDSEEGKKAGGERVDCFTDTPAQGKALHVPDKLFFDEQRGLLTLFHRYKFTVEENTPIDEEVALDPELLGQVFENLLAAYNPETRETVRKHTGSYYTPRAVVDYMVDESLLAYLSGKVTPQDNDADSWQKRLRCLLDYADDSYADAAQSFTDTEKKQLVHAIADIKVLDPAVGSGAFPMGVLHKLVLVLSRLDEANTLWSELHKARAMAQTDEAYDEEDDAVQKERVNEINDTFQRYRSDFGRKLFLIQNSIFGVDIQPMACQIAKLRFFISLAIEQEAKPEAGNYGIKPLPNLETRFVAANTLLRIAQKGTARTLISDRVTTIQRELREIREKHFNACTREQKLAYTRAFEDKQKMLAKELKKGDYGEDEADKIAAWNPFDQNTVADWFDPEWMFGEKGGFDVVIGNPPYVVSKDKKLRELFTESVYGRANLYGFFIHKSIQDLIKRDGIVAFINPKTLLTDAYSSMLRKWILENAAVAEILNIVDRRKVFESVLQSVIINFFQKEKDETRIKNINHISEIKLNKHIRINTSDMIYHQNDRPIFLVCKDKLSYEIFRKLGCFPSLSASGFEFKTGNIQWDKYKDDLSAKRSKNSIRIIWAENIQRYFIGQPRLRQDKMWLADGVNKLSLIHTKTIIVQRTTAVEQPYRIIATLANPDHIGGAFVAENHTSFLASNNDDQSMFLCLGLLLSKLHDFIFRHVNSNTQVSAGELNSLPFIANLNKNRKEILKISQGVSQILKAKHADSTCDTYALEAEIDELVYELYGLTEEEKNIIDPSRNTIRIKE